MLERTTQQRKEDVMGIGHDALASMSESGIIRYSFVYEVASPETAASQYQLNPRMLTMMIEVIKEIKLGEVDGDSRLITNPETIRAALEYLKTRVLRKFDQQHTRAIPFEGMWKVTGHVPEWYAN
ncbi:hypothetical protein COV81_05020 [Candidatus Peregrinibacteria bacterium CG11_big_fil_rev_8_21_14_0_20_41_10]|nr:MAG: hypothetical protein COV81_05020 [Candidatus Peregrinibacteria bacterium CG11_big_fil_rev_8_21_14_0_20_41_10]PIZ73447.1 MAG: hypothetical protein COY06_05335 [Candidatus Peregrinibacteria bacterium CG_4_10_14_0_2_um_filter_41_8]PJC37785.1 MAG: hypothetical protein CO045_03710 [Candidatus Peregrinibacteria bacterium CG_4_9_14_0_2_um_filter_41_14]